MSIIAIVLGAFYILLDGGGLILLLAAYATPILVADPNLFGTTWMKAAGLSEEIIGLLLACVLMAGGIGALQLRRWARKLLLRWAVAELTFQLLCLALSLYLTVTAPIPAFQQTITVNNGPGGVVTYNYHASAPGVTGVVRGVLTTLCLCIFPVLVLLLWRKPDVVEAFEEKKRPNPG